MTKVAILGASGYAGAELLRLCHGHPHLEVVVAGAHSAAGELVGESHPHLGVAYPDLAMGEMSADAVDGCDVAFLALPHGESQKLVPQMAGRVGTVIDLAADFRLKDPGLYPRWYGAEHMAPELLSTAAFGLPELFRPELSGARLVAAAGCYVTAAALALAPFVRRGLVAADGLIVDAASGVSGAGRKATETTHFSTVEGNFTAYGLIDHRHTPEMEQAIGGGAQVLFTPHLAPMSRGILATCYARPLPGAMGSTEEALAVLREFYGGEPFVDVIDGVPSTKVTTGSNVVVLTARLDPRTGWLIIISALDNLVKGAAGQAVQCANAVLGLDEAVGLPTIGIRP